MFSILATAIGGGLATGALLFSQGPLLAVVGAPLGGSACAAAAAFALYHRRGEAGRAEGDHDRSTDEMVAILRGLAAEGRRIPEVAPATDESAAPDRQRGVA
ncbi:hypothetical protein [Methylobacterium oryzihabitans]|uniref:Uncharacterized protein n=1 Tax=Methylobacterium oryzihabitans TaxID=2499852 RepID=A0A437P717_9HYPH|nr:hypothetical protein [Methylobacterium oryzihabitans]RVU18065.1 hypothetical protein EOE48_11760 [Methylobacterium oryzihabitans]